MTVANNILNLEGEYKEQFAKKWADLTLRNRPLSAMVERDEDLTGTDLKVPALTSSGAGVATTVAVAQSQAASVSMNVPAFAVTRTKLYSIVQIDNEAILASESKEGAFFEISSTALEQAINKMSNYLEIYMFGDGSGALGQMANSTVSTSVIQLASIATAINFEKGDRLDLSGTNTGTGSLRAQGTNAHPLFVGTVNEDLGQLTIVNAAGTAVNINDSADGVVSPGTTDYIFATGTKGAVLKGLGAWLPKTAPTSGDSFYGVDRSQAVSKLAGLRSDETTSGKTIKEMLIDAHMKVAARDGNLDVFFMSYPTYGALCKELEATAFRPDHGAGEVSFPSVELITNSGVVKCVPANRCSTSDIWGLDMSTVHLGSIGPAVRGLEVKDQLEWLRLNADDAVESRIGTYSAFFIDAPYRNIHISIPSQG